MSEDQAKADNETRMRQSLGLTNGSRPIVSDETQRMARQAIRSQTSAREYAERHLVRAEQTIEELRAKVHAIAREKAVAIQAARAAHDAQVRAEQGRRAAETALINAKSAVESARPGCPRCARNHAGFAGQTGRCEPGGRSLAG